MRSTECDGLSGLYCEGFEDGVGGLTLDVDDGAQATVIPSGAYRGRGALRVATPAGTDYSYLSELVFSGSETDQWLRAMFRFPTAAVLENEVMAFYDTSFDNALVSYIIRQGYIDVHAHGVFAGGIWGVDDDPFGDGWYCLEIHAHYGAGESYVEGFIDGRLFASSPRTLTLNRRLSRISVGALYHPRSEDLAEILVDEVVAHSSRVPCP